jgi:flagellar motility protein MotE (MotC chaperone)
VKSPRLNSPRLKSPRLKSPRLLPVVIFATTALLLFKGVALVTGGEYGLIGTQVASAAETGPAAAPAGAAGAPDGGTASIPATGAGGPLDGPTLVDPNPVISDNSPTLAGPAPKAGSEAAPPAAAAAPAGAGKLASLPGAALPGTGPAASVPVCPPDAAASPEDTAGKVTAKVPTPGVNCDAVAMAMGPNGKPEPLAEGPMSPTELKLIDRLKQRGAELDKLAASLDMRAAVVKAAEQQMQARADQLKALQQQIQTLEDQKKSMQDARFAGIVKMYETMKPQQAAAIFDGLDMAVLMRVAEAMDPRKMSPILAQMASDKAEQLTTRMTATGPDTAMDTPSPDAAGLPQIVGH